MIINSLNINLLFLSVVSNLIDPLLDEGGGIGDDLAW